MELTPPPNSFMGSAHAARIDSIRMLDTNNNDLPGPRRISTSTVRLGSSAWHGGFARYAAQNNQAAMHSSSGEAPK